MKSTRPKLIGRVAEREVLRTALESSEPELVAVYGRRRVGKTFLVREALAELMSFELVGMHDASLGAQLAAFATALASAGSAQTAPESWTEAFGQLQRHLEGRFRRGRRQVVFFDEIPWLSSPRSGFLPAFEHFWNAWATKQRALVVVLCGSAASWMIDHLLRARGGLHNRVTRRLRLQPFTVAEANAFLASRGADLAGYSTLELYMAMGGVPHYLKEVQRGESAAQAIDRVCFSREGLLRDEFGALYSSLFQHAERHERLVRALAAKPRGRLRNDLLDAAGLASGGGATAMLDELEAAGFVMRAPQFGREARDSLYRLADEYSLFFLRWIEGARGRRWTQQRSSAAWRAWSGYAYEGIWLSHTDRLKRALGIEAVETVESTWQIAATGDEPGAQVDLVIDRRDGCINLCEMKFSEGEIVIDKRLASELRARRDAFRRATKTKKTLLVTLVTTHGLRRNTWSDELVARTVTMDALLDGR